MTGCFMGRILPQVKSNCRVFCEASAGGARPFSSVAVGGLARFYVPRLPSAAGELVQIEDGEFWHLAKARRLGPKDRLELFDGQGGLVEAEVINIRRHLADVVAVEAPRLLPWEGARWHLLVACGSLKGGRLDWLVEKCTELGAASLTPVLTERSPVFMADSKSDRLERVALAAAKQSQRLHAIDIRPAVPLLSVIPQVSEAPSAYLAQAQGEPLARVEREQGLRSGGVLLVGPEGDFTPKEVDICVESGALLVGLGPLRLRVETAAIAMLSHMMLNACA